MSKTLSTTLTLLALSTLPSPARPQEGTVLTEDLCATCSLEVIPDVLLGADGESVIGMAWDSLDEIPTKSPLRPSEHPARWTLRFTCSRCKDNIT
ncbi:MAG: hypothetical protein OXL34_07255 [Gemmatimonadota bacterium]|nr:hypothetical protein [Gemmatimonadota bacterium]